MEEKKDGIREGIKAGLGILSALKEAIEETVDEMRQRGDITPDRAKDVVQSTMKRAQDAMEDARERFDFVTRKEFDALKAEIAELRDRIATREGAPQGTVTNHYAPGVQADAHHTPEHPHG